MLIETVPIYVDARPGCYNPKYGDHVLKAMIGCTLTRCVCFFGDGLYCGASSDSFIQDCDVLRFLSSRGIRALADGGFYECQRIIAPHDKTHIWPSLQANKPISDYVREADVKLAYNESLSHFRAHVEHIFSRSCIGRWLVFKNWTIFSDSLLYYSFAYCLIIHNLEVYLRHECGGKYSPFTPERVIPDCSGWSLASQTLHRQIWKFRGRRPLPVSACPRRHQRAVANTMRRRTVRQHGLPKRCKPGKGAGSLRGMSGTVLRVLGLVGSLPSLLE